LSEIRANTISDAAGTGPVTLTKQSAAKAWGRFASATVYDSFNVSSATDYGTGDEGVSFTSAFDNIFYSTGAISQAVSALAYVTSLMDNANYRTKTTSHFTYRLAWASTVAASTTFYDDGQAAIIVHGDLA